MEFFNWTVLYWTSFTSYSRYARNYFHEELRQIPVQLVNQGGGIFPLPLYLKVLKIGAKGGEWVGGKFLATAKGTL